jgi:hypothetical protein
VQLQDIPLITPDDFNRVLGLFKATFSHLILDLSKSYSPLDIAALKAAKDILLVTQLDLACGVALVEHGDPGYATSARNITGIDVITELQRAVHRHAFRRQWQWRQWGRDRLERCQNRFLGAQGRHRQTQAQRGPARLQQHQDRQRHASGHDLRRQAFGIAAELPALWRRGRGGARCRCERQDRGAADQADAREFRCLLPRGQCGL